MKLPGFHVTFVTSYFSIYPYVEYYDLTKTFDLRLELFLKVVATGIPIAIVISPDIKDRFEEITKEYKNVCILDVYDHEQLQVRQLVQNIPAFKRNLPSQRCPKKDTLNYMLLMNSKIEFVKKAIDKNPFETETFAWFDFSLPYVFKEVDKSIAWMKTLASEERYKKDVLTMPGCWDKKHLLNKEDSKNLIRWRFCGGFSLGSRSSYENFYRVSLEHYLEFVTWLDNTFVWETNYWEWLEYHGHIEPRWYAGDHNDSILNVPLQSLVETKRLLDTCCAVRQYDFVSLEEKNQRMYPSSAAYIFDPVNKLHLLNTRYVNYTYGNNWDCFFHNDRRQIRTLNVISILKEEETNETVLIPLDYKNVSIDESCLRPCDLCRSSQGFEDIRMYLTKEEKIQFIASNMSYSKDGQTHIVIGDYVLQEDGTVMCMNSKMIDTCAHCEKNWTPLPYEASKNDGRNLFIYKWFPYCVGSVSAENTFDVLLEMEQEGNHVTRRFRGSTNFVVYEKDPNYFIGVVHFSESTVPPTYYHSLVLIDKLTLLPKYYSHPFKFGLSPIEFCLGFIVFPKQEKFGFWFSQMDRNPLYITVNQDEIPISNPFC